MTVAEPIESLAAPTDAGLLAAVANGDSVALGQLAHRYVPFIHAAALRQTGDPATADDVTQAVLIVLSNKASAIAARALPAWLHQTTRYAAANANRAARRRRVHERRAARPEGQMDPTPEEINPLLALLDGAIAKLGETDRRAIVGRFLLNQDAATVAAGLGVSTRAAQKRIERAVEKLRERMAAAQRSQRSAMTSTVPMKSLAITPAVAAAVLTAAAPVPASAAVVAVPTVAATTLAKQTAAWLTIAKVKALALAVIATTLTAGAVGAVAMTVIKARSGPATLVLSPPMSTAVAPGPAAASAPKISTGGALKNGVALTLLGTAENPSEGKPWFAPDGTPLAGRPYRSAMTTIGQPGEVSREFAFAYDPQRISLLTQSYPDIDTATLRVDVARSQPFFPYVGPLRVLGNDDMDKSGVIGVVRKGQPGQAQSLFFEIAAGPWVPRIVSQADADVNIVAQNDVIVAGLSQPFEDWGEASVLYKPAQFYSRPDTRLVAIDRDGKAHAMDQRSSWYRPPKELFAEPLYLTMLPRMTFDNTPFNEVVRQLEAQGVPVAVDWEGLAATHKVTRETPVTGTIGPERLFVALERLFQWVGDQGEPQFDVKDGVLIVSAFDMNHPQPWPMYAPGVPLSKLDRFEVQTRNFDQWVSFENLTAELGKPANLVIRTSDDGVGK